MKTTTALNLLLGLISIVILFHLLIVFKIIPYEVTWGGRLQSDQEMYLFESISILVNLFLGMVILVKSGRVKPFIHPKVANVVLWFFLILFALNTIGNVFAETTFEKSLSILTLLFTILIGVILKGKPDSKKE